MFNKKDSFVTTVFAFLSFVGATAANAQPPACYTVAALQGQYSLVGTYGANLAIAFGMRYFDGSGNLTGTFVVNEPTAGSTTGARTIVTGSQTGIYTVNCDGTGVITTTLATSTGVVATQMYDFVITGAVQQGNSFDATFLATAFADAQRTPSAIIPGGVFLTRVYTLLPNRTSQP
jgi:hypothetical protein